MNDRRRVLVQLALVATLAVAAIMGIAVGAAFLLGWSSRRSRSLPGFGESGRTAERPHHLHDARELLREVSLGHHLTGEERSRLENDRRALSSGAGPSRPTAQTVTGLNTANFESSLQMTEGPSGASREHRSSD